MRVVSLLIASALLLLTTSVHAVTIHVPDDQPTIQADIVAGRGPSPDARGEVRVFNAYDGYSIHQWLSLDAFPSLTHGSKVAAGRF